MSLRPSKRAVDELRKIEFELGYPVHAEGACIARFGNTHVMCTVTIEEKLPPFLRDKKKGWITAEYGMLPCSTDQRVTREATRGKQSGRTQEIQRLIGRSLRAITDLKALGERQVRVDCDVLQADGGTRTAAITGSYIALWQALQGLVKAGKLKELPLTDQVAAISCGIYQGTPVLDLDYTEDSSAEADANFIMTQKGGIVEVQATAETSPFSQEHYQGMFTLASKGISELIRMQNRAFAKILTDTNVKLVAK
ncbi:MAG: ribonuclease PH [Pseudomonadota bacterium]